MPFYSLADLTNHKIIIGHPLTRDGKISITPINGSSSHSLELPSRIPMYQLPLEILLHWAWLQTQNESPHASIWYKLDGTHPDPLTVSFSTIPDIITKSNDTSSEIYGDHLLLPIETFIQDMLWRPILGASIS